MTRSPPHIELPWDLVLEPDEARRRFAWARERGHPQYLWPEVSPAALRGALRALEAVARDVLAGRAAELTGEGFAPAAGDDVAAARALGVAGFTSGLGPLVGRWIEEGEVAAGELVGRLFALHLAHGRARAERLGRMLGEVVDALDAAGVEPLVVKSAHTARVHFPEPGVRPAVDVDLVVEPGDFAPAERALARAGFHRAAGQRRPRKSDWLAPGAAPLPRSLELLHADSQYAVDLHDSLERNYHGVRTVRPAAVHDAARAPATFVDGRAGVLRQPLLLAYHALHASEGLEHLTLVRLVELVRMVREDRASGALGWSELRSLLSRSGGLGFVLPALLLAERLAPGTFDAGLLEASRRAAPSSMRRVLADLRPGDAQRFDVLTLRERFMWCSTPGDYLKRLGHMLLPAPASASVRRLVRMYVDRAYRLRRGNVALRRPSE